MFSPSLLPPPSLYPACPLADALLLCKQLYGAVGQPHPPASLKAGGAKKLAHGGNGTEANAFCSAAFLEFAHPHSTLNHDALRTFAGSDTTLKQGETYANWTRAEVWIA
jgi:hypothetical protein